MTRDAGRVARRSRWSRERGSVMPVVAFVSLILAVLGIGGAVLGRTVAARQDAQRAADGAALAMADLIREQGLPAALPRAMQIGQFSDRSPLGWNPSWREEPTRLVAQVAASGQLAAWRYIWDSGSIPVNARASAIVGQEVHEIDNWSPPQLMLVLDYSGSMGEAMGGNRSRIDALEDGVQRMFDQGYRIEFGATLFDSSIVASERFGPDSVGRILQLLRNHGPGSGTCTSCGLRSGRELLADSPDTGADKFVVLVSDGSPNDGGGEEGARQEAARLWDDNVSIFSLHVGAGGGLQAFMESVAGTPDHHPYPEDYYFQVTDPESFRQALEAIAAAIACRTPRPLNMQAIEDMATLRVFLREGGRERRIEESPNLIAGNIEGYQLERTGGRLRFTPRACNAIIDRGAQIVVRYNRARLIE
jgi:hypothetical protein